MEEIIKKYLAQRALTDDSVARNMKKAGKSIKGCCDYIKKKAREAAKDNVAMIEDAVVFGWAVHYFDEDNLQEDKKPVPAVKVIAKPETAAKPNYIQCDLFGDME